MTEKVQKLRDAASLCQREHLLPTGQSRIDLQWRLGLRNALQSGDLNYYDRCNLTEVLQPDTIKFFSSAEKNSVSDSVIAAGVLNYPRDDKLLEQYQEYWNRHKCDVILKITFPRLYRPAMHRDLVDPLTAEVMLYEYLNKLVQMRVTPNLVLSLGVYDCTFAEVARNTDPQINEKLQKAALAIYKGKNVAPSLDDPVRFLLLERGRGKSLYDMLENKNLSESQVVSLLFQVLYTLSALSDRGVRHADLHLGNVFVDRLSEPKTVLHYFPNPEKSENYMSVPTFGVVAKLFDWDWGGIYPQAKFFWPPPEREILNDLAVDSCISVTSCNSNEKADAFILLSSLYNMPQARSMKNVMQFIERSVHRQLLNFAAPNSPDNFSRRGGFQYRLCDGPFEAVCRQDGQLQKTSEGCKRPWNKVPDCAMKSPFQMLADPIFAPFFRDAAKSPLPTKYVYGNWSNKSQYDAVMQQLEPI